MEIEEFEGDKWSDVPAELARAVVENIRKWKDRDRREAHFMWHNTVGHYSARLGRKLPSLMQLLDPHGGNDDFKEGLQTNTDFCFRAGIPRGETGDYLDHIRAAVAEIYWDERCWRFSDFG